MKSRLCKALLIGGLSIVALAATPLFAQEATLSGTVTDPSGTAVSGATVSVRNTVTAVVLQNASDNEGKFTFTGIAPGTYELTLRQAGFTTTVRSVTLSAGQSLEQTFALALPTVATSLNVQEQLSALPVESPSAQVVMSADLQDFLNTPASNAADIFELVPGVTSEQANGPRDIVISVRGSSERQTYGIRNLMVSEDGFPTTQPDGLSRTDMIDPHVYSGVDVVQGPSSALYGNNALDGQINFHTRQFQGIELGSDFGSFGYQNDYLATGASGDNYRVSGFLSDALGNLFTAHTQSNTFTANLLAEFSPTKKDRILFKFINNELNTQLSVRLSLNQYIVNPWQQGCATLAANGCASVSVYVNGFNGTKESLSPQEAGLGRHDRRTVTGARWEHDLSDNTLFRSQFVWDVKDINQPTGATSVFGPTPSFNVVNDITRHGTLFGLGSTTYAAISFNYEDQRQTGTNVAPGGQPFTNEGGVASTTLASDWNGGGRVRQELALGRKWIVTGGVGFERSGLAGKETLYTYPTSTSPTLQLVTARQLLSDTAVEGSVRYQLFSKLALHTHAGNGYGTPSVSNYFINSQGVYGNNTGLKPQTNRGVDVGADFNPGVFLKLSAAGFYDWFHNELVTQSPGVNLLSYTYNAPGSAHRGFEGVAEVRPLYTVAKGLRLRASYIYDRQTYTNYNEQLSAGNFTQVFNRDGEYIPGVIPTHLDGRIVYDQLSGKAGGLGGFLEEDIRSSFFLDNANLIKAPGANTLNLNFHYNPTAEKGLLSRLTFYVEVKNVLSKQYVAGATNITDTISSTTGAENGVATLATSGSIYAGEPRAFFGGVKIKLRR